LLSGSIKRVSIDIKDQIVFLSYDYEFKYASTFNYDDLHDKFKIL